MLDRIFEHARKPSQAPPSTAAEKLTLERVRETVRRLGEEWPKRKRDLDAVQNWLNATKGRMNQMSERLEILKTWVDLYNTASEAAHGSIRFQGWLSVTSPGKEKENWQALAQEIYLHLSPIEMGYEHCAMKFTKDTSSFAALQAEILHALGRFKTDIDYIEASLPVLREAQEEAKCREALQQIQNNATEMAKCSVQLCQRLYHAIGELVNELGKPIKEL